MGKSVLKPCLNLKFVPPYYYLSTQHYVASYVPEEVISFQDRTLILKIQIYSKETISLQKLIQPIVKRYLKLRIG